MDQLEYLTDPKANQQQKARVSKWQRDYGADHWWKPGEVLPERAPGF
jgi:hypothetical protein